MSRFLACLLFFAPAFCWAAEPTILPVKEGMYVGIVRVETESGWACLSQNFDPVDLTLIEGDDAKGFKTCVVHGPPGKYAVLQINGLKVTTHKLVLGGIAPAPVPPPGPNPPPPPDPVPPVPTPAGSRMVLIFHESAEQTTDQGRMFNQLRNQHAAYLKEHKHRLYILDDDSADSDGNLVFQSWKKHIEGQPLPLMIVTDDKANVVWKGPLPASADAVMAQLKASGG